MTLRELSQLKYLKREIAMDRQRLAELESKALPGAQVISGMPTAAGYGDKLGSYAAEIADLKAVILAKQRRCLAEQRRLEVYIASIDDSFIRQIFTLRFVNGLTWRQVARKMGGNNTTGSVKMIVRRFLAKN